MVTAWSTLFTQWTGRHHHATIGPRIAAAGLDVVPFLPLAAIGYVFQDEWTAHPWGWIWPALMLAMSSAYYIGFHARYGATPGKALLRCRLLSTDEKTPITARQAIRREIPWIIVGTVSLLPLGSFAEYLPTAWLLACLACILYDLKNRSLDDCFAKVILVREVIALAATTTTPSGQSTRLPHYYQPASPAWRAAAGFINFSVVVALQFVASALSGVESSPILATGSVEQLEVYGSLVITFWLGCGLIRTSPGAYLCNLRILQADNRRPSSVRALLRSAPFLFFFLSTLAGRQPDLPPWFGFFPPLLLLLLLTNSLYLAWTSTPLFDRWSGIRIYRVNFREPNCWDAKSN